METQKSSTSLGRWSLLLLSLVMPLATGQTLSYQEAVLQAVDGFNKQSSEESLYRLLRQDLQPEVDEDPYIPKPVSFVLKETVCPKNTEQPPEQCDFKENGVVKQCVGTVILDQATGSFDISCNGPQRVKRIGWLPNLIKQGGRKIGEKIERIGGRIREFFS